MTDQIGLFEAMATQRQITRFKKDPVPREAIDQIIEAATKAPSGGNTQPWAFVVITDPELVSKIGLIYKELWLGSRGDRPASPETPVYQAARYLANHFHEVPAMILVCVDHSRRQDVADPVLRSFFDPRIDAFSFRFGIVAKVGVESVGAVRLLQDTQIVFAKRKRAVAPKCVGDAQFIFGYLWIECVQFLDNLVVAIGSPEELLFDFLFGGF